MSEKIEEPKKCSIHTEIFLVPTAYNPSIYVCPECRKERYVKMVKTKAQKKKLKNTMLKGKITLDAMKNKKVELDFTEHMKIIEALSKSAKENFRTVESEILYTLHNVLNPKGE